VHIHKDIVLSASPPCEGRSWEEPVG
jgi:hypothetical protein